MSRILEYKPAPQDLVVSRVVTLVHKVVDREFPAAAPPPKRFARTLFSEQEEPTVNQVLPGEAVNTEAWVGPVSASESALMSSESPLEDPPETRSFRTQTFVLWILGLIATAAAGFLVFRVLQ